MRTLLTCGVATILICISLVSFAGTATEWSGIIVTSEAQSQFSFGTYPGAVDGYDEGYPLLDWTRREVVYIALYRTNGPNWAGPTGFYPGDPTAPVPPGGSKTWSDLYLWSYNYTPPLVDRVGLAYVWMQKPPAGYTGIVTLDYVPASLNWTGPNEFRIDLTKSRGFYLPVPITSDPYNPDNVTRMHLTVYTTPEPSSLAALAFALAGVGMGFVRRRR